MFFNNKHICQKAEPKKKEVPTYAIFSDYTLDVDNPDEVVEDADYVFVGKVTEETGTIYKNKTPINKKMVQSSILVKLIQITK